MTVHIAPAPSLARGRCDPYRAGFRICMAAEAVDRRGPSGTRPCGASGRASVRSRPVAAVAGPSRPGGAARTAGPDTGAGTRPDPVRPDARVAVHVLPGRGVHHGRRPGRHASVRRHGAAVRRRPSVQLRPVRHPRATDAVRHQRLRRDVARSVGVGRQAARGQLRGDGPRPRVHPRGSTRHRHGRHAGVPGSDARRRRDGWCAGVVRAPGGRRAAEVGPPGGPRQARQQARGPGPRGDGGEGPLTGQHPRAGQTRRHRRRRTSDRRRPPDHRPDRGTRPSWHDLGRPRARHQEAARVLPANALPPASPARGVPVRARGPEGRRRGQRRNPLLHPVARRPRQQRPALPPDQGGAAVRPRALPRPERVSEPRAAGRRRSAADAGSKRHLPRLATHHRPRRRDPRLLRAAVPRLEGQRRRRHDAGARSHPVLPHLRRHPRPRPRPLGRPHRHRRLPREGTRVRPRDRASSQRPTPTRTNATTPRSARPSRPDGSWLTPTCSRVPHDVLRTGPLRGSG